MGTDREEIMGEMDNIIEGTRRDDIVEVGGMGGVGRE